MVRKANESGWWNGSYPDEKREYLQTQTSMTSQEINDIINLPFSQVSDKLEENGVPYGFYEMKRQMLGDSEFEREYPDHINESIASEGVANPNEPGIKGEWDNSGLGEREELLSKINTDFHMGAHYELVESDFDYLPSNYQRQLEHKWDLAHESYAKERDIAMTNRQINDQAYDIMAQEEWGKSVEQLTDSEYKWIEDVMNDYGNELTGADKPKAGESKKRARESRKLNAKQKSLISNWVSGMSSPPMFIQAEDLPYELFEQITQINDYETLHQDIGRYASDIASDTAMSGSNPYMHSSNYNSSLESEKPYNKNSDQGYVDWEADMDRIEKEAFGQDGEAGDVDDTCDICGKSYLTGDHDHASESKANENRGRETCVHCGTTWSYPYFGTDPETLFEYDTTSREQAFVNLKEHLQNYHKIPNALESKAKEYMSMRTYRILKNGEEIDMIYGEYSDARKKADQLGADQIYDMGDFYMTDYGKGEAKEFKPELQGKTIRVIHGLHTGKTGIVVNVEIFGDGVGVNIDGEDMMINGGDYVLANEGWKPRIQRCNENVSSEGFEDDIEHLNDDQCVRCGEDAYWHTPEGSVSWNSHPYIPKKDLGLESKVKANEKGETYIFLWNHSDLGESGRTTLLTNSGLDTSYSTSVWNDLPDNIKEGLKPTMNDLFKQTGQESKKVKGNEAYAREDCYRERWSGLTDEEKDKLEAKGIGVAEWNTGTDEDRKKLEDDAKLHGEASPTEEEMNNYQKTCPACNGYGGTLIDQGGCDYCGGTGKIERTINEAGLYGYGSATGRMPPAESWNQGYLGGGEYGTGNQMSDSERDMFSEFRTLQWSELPADIQELWKSIAEYIPSGEARANEDYEICTICAYPENVHPLSQVLLDDGQGGYTRYGGQHDYVPRIVEESNENWRDVANDLIKEQNKKGKGKKRSSEVYAKEWGYGDLSPDAEKLQDFDYGIGGYHSYPEYSDYVERVKNGVPIQPSQISGSVMGELEDINYHTFVGVLMELGAPSPAGPSGESRASEEYSVPSKGTTNGDWLWTHYEWNHSMDQDDIECKTCGYQLRPFGVYSIESEIMKEARQHMEGHGLTESRASEWNDQFNPNRDLSDPNWQSSGSYHAEQSDRMDSYNQNKIESKFGTKNPVVPCPYCNVAYHGDWVHHHLIDHIYDEHGKTLGVMELPSSRDPQASDDLRDTNGVRPDSSYESKANEAYVNKEIWNGIDDIIFRLTLLERAGFNEDVRVGWYTGAETWEDLNADNASLISALSSTSITEQEIKDTSSTGFYPELFGEAMKFDEDGNLIKSAGSVKTEQDDTALSINEAQLQKVEKDGWEFSVIDTGYGGDYDGGTKDMGLLEVGIFPPDSHGLSSINDSKIKGWMTPVEVEELKQTFLQDPAVAYRNIGGEIESEWQKGLEYDPDVDGDDEEYEYAMDQVCTKCGLEEYEHGYGHEFSMRDENTVAEEGSVPCPYCGSYDSGLNVTTGSRRCHDCKKFFKRDGGKDDSGISAMLFDGFG